ncbi:MAG: hypothetical protein R2911_00235 [Caldilineaceae bacterium]
MLLDEPAALNALQWLADLANVDGVAPTRELQDDLESDDFFLAGKAAMRIVGQWELAHYVVEADFPFGLAPLPRGGMRSTAWMAVAMPLRPIWRSRRRPGSL